MPRGFIVAAMQRFDGRDEFGSTHPGPPPGERRCRRPGRPSTVHRPPSTVHGPTPTPARAAALTNLSVTRAKLTRHGVILPRNGPGAKWSDDKVDAVPGLCCVQACSSTLERSTNFSPCTGRFASMQISRPAWPPRSRRCWFTLEFYCNAASRFICKAIACSLWLNSR